MHFKLLSATLLCLILSGCSVVMATRESKEVDIAKIQQGQTRAQVEELLGKPIQFIRLPSGDRATYQYMTGLKPNYKKAAAYAVLGGLTLGLSELATSPAEMVQGDRNVVEVLYDIRGRVKNIRHTVNDAPMKKPEDLVS